jgi:hypothetical protein
LKSREEYDAMYKRSIDDPVGFWSDIAKQFHWCARACPRSVSHVRTCAGLHGSWDGRSGWRLHARARNALCSATCLPRKRRRAQAAACCLVARTHSP